MRELLLLVLLLSVTCAVAAPSSPSGKYADAVLEAMRGMVDQLDTYSRLAEMAAPHVATTGDIWLAGDRGFVLEGLNRAGGLMLVKEMKEPPAPAPVNMTAAIPTLPVILYGAFTPDATGSELESDQAEVLKRLLPGRMVLPVTPRGIWPDEHGVDIGAMHSADGLPLGAPVVTAHLWTFTAELVSALTRLGKLPPMYQSVVVPGGRERNAGHLKLQWEPGPVAPIREGQLGREYLARVANSLRRLKTSQADKFAEAGRLAADTAAAGHTVWYGSLGHLPPELPSISGDPGLVKPLAMSNPDKLGQFVKPGDLILYVGYYEPWGPWVETAHGLGAKIVTVVSGTPERRAEDMGADINIDACWAYGDAVVDVPGYDIRVLPPSGVVASAAYSMLMAEFAAARAGAHLPARE